MSDFIDHLREQFPDIEVRGDLRTDPAMKTAFVWTQQPHTIVLAANRKYYAAALANPNIAVIVAPPEAIDSDTDKTIVVLPDAEDCFYFIHNQLANHVADSLPPPQVHPRAIVEDGVRLGPGVCVAKGVRIGANSVLQGPVQVDEDASIEPGVVIGCEGLFAKRIAGELVHVRHFGGVHVGAGAYIHSGAVVVRSAMYGENTTIGNRAHIGVMSNVGHDVQIEEEAVISSNTVIAGRARIGARAWIGASATVSNAVNVGENARVNIGAVCIQDVGEAAEVSGNFAREHAVVLKEFLKRQRGG